jgi:hypothetical protein
VREMIGSQLHRCCCVSTMKISTPLPGTGQCTLSEEMSAATTSSPTALDVPELPLTREPTSSPTSSPSATGSPPVVCPQFFSFDDAHGSYELWLSSFIKFEGFFQTHDDDFGYDYGYVPAMEILGGYLVAGFKPNLMLGLRPGPGATFSVVGGKLDAHGSLMPCDIESAGSGPCFTSRSWEIGLSSKSFYNSFYATETAAWIAPFGSSMSAECFPESEWGEFTETRVRPVAFTGEGRSHNNVRPPSFHVPPPLPHESVELSLTLKDGGGKGWWNTLKFHPNQYVLDDGEDILHRGTLVDRGEATDKVSQLPLLSFLACYPHSRPVLSSSLVF